MNDVADVEKHFPVRPRGVFAASPFSRQLLRAVACLQRWCRARAERIRSERRRLLLYSQGELEKIRVWFRDYKKPDGKPENKFGYNDKCMDKCARGHRPTAEGLGLLFAFAFGAGADRRASAIPVTALRATGSSRLGLSRRRTSSGSPSRTAPGRTTRSSRSTRLQQRGAVEPQQQRSTGDLVLIVDNAVFFRASSSMVSSKR